MCVLTYFKHKLQRGLTRLQSDNPVCLWTKIDKEHFNLPNDVFLCNTYIVPKDSPYFHRNETDVLSILHAEINPFITQGDILIIGDLNSRLGQRQETFENITGSPGDTDTPELETLPCRNTQDSVCNTNGVALLGIVNDCHIMALNGRIPGDLSGTYTYHGPTASSTIDLALVSSELHHSLKYLRGRDPVFYSDHCPLTLAIGTANRRPSNNATGNKLKPIEKILWKKEHSEGFQAALSSKHISGLLEQFRKTTYEDTNEASCTLTKIITVAAKEVCKVMRCTNNKSSQSGTGNKRPMSDKAIQTAKGVFKKAKRDFQKQKDSLDRTASFHSVKRKYMHTVSRVQKLYRELKLRDLADIEKRDPKTFWRNVRDIIKPDTRSDDTITPGEWRMHFEHILNTRTEKNDKQFDDFVTHSLPLLADISVPNPMLNTEITESEVINALNKLRPGKSPGLDLITNEMLKAGPDTIAEPLCHIFNTILKRGDNPKTWVLSMIVLIPKKGGLSNPHNYRDIAISSCLSKTLNSILNERLESFLKSGGKLRQNQCGFIKSNRTEDNIFVLQTIFNLYIQQDNKIYLAFVDFRKYFNTINRKYLLYKLLNLDITGKFYEILRSMYDVSDLLC